MKIEQLRELCTLTVELTRLRQNECKCLSIENVAPEIFGKLIRELSLDQEINPNELVLREALSDMLSGWRYIRESYGDLYGIGWDRAQKKAEEALGFAERSVED